MKLEIRCSCGQLYHADPAHVGRAIRCRCGNILTIAAPPSPAPSGRGSRFRLPRLPRLHFRKLVVPPRISNFLVLLAWGYLALSLTYAALLWLAGDAWWLATLLLFMPRWPILLPVPLLAPAALLIRPRLLLPLGLAAIVSVGPAMGYRLGARGWLTASARAELRIITFNVDSRDNPRLLAIPMGLEPYHPDVVVLQECAENLAAAEHWPAGWTVRFEQSFCLASRFPVLEARPLERIETGEQGGTGNAVFYRLRSDAGIIDLAVLHLETPRKGLEQLRYRAKLSGLASNELVREVGSRRMSRWITEQSSAVIVAGDFNLPVESRIYRSHWNRCDNAFSRVGHGFGWTRVLPHFSIRIDHVLTCGGWRPLRAVVGPDLGSDHLPLIVDLARRR